MFDAILRTYRGGEEAGPAEVFNYSNRYFFTRKLRGSLITAAILHYEPRYRRLTYANAGHPPVIMLSPRGEIQFLDTQAGIPLGVQQDWQWQDASIEVEPATRFIVYTDGIIEALSPQHEQFGLERLLAVIENRAGTLDDLISRVRSALQQHQAGMPRTDDQALLVFEIESS